MLGFPENYPINPWNYFPTFPMCVITIHQHYRRTDDLDDTS